MVDTQLLGLSSFCNFVELFNFDGLSTLLENQILGLANLEKHQNCASYFPLYHFNNILTVAVSYTLIIGGRSLTDVLLKLGSQNYNLDLKAGD